MAENNLCQLTREVQRQTFTALECHLYLNTHPDCQEAAAAFAKACEKLDAAREKNYLEPVADAILAHEKG